MCNAASFFPRVSRPKRRARVKSEVKGARCLARLLLNCTRDLRPVGSKRCPTANTPLLSIAAYPSDTTFLLLSPLPHFLLLLLLHRTLLLTTVPWPPSTPCLVLSLPLRLRPTEVERASAARWSEYEVAETAKRQELFPWVVSAVRLACLLTFTSPDHFNIALWAAR